MSQKKNLGSLNRAHDWSACALLNPMVFELLTADLIKLCSLKPSVHVQFCAVVHSWSRSSLIFFYLTAVTRGNICVFQLQATSQMGCCGQQSAHSVPNLKPNMLQKQCELLNLQGKRTVFLSVSGGCWSSLQSRLLTSTRMPGRLSPFLYNCSLVKQVVKFPFNYCNSHWCLGANIYSFLLNVITFPIWRHAYFKFLWTC